MTVCFRTEFRFYNGLSVPSVVFRKKRPLLVRYYVLGDDDSHVSLHRFLCVCSDYGVSALKLPRYDTLIVSRNRVRAVLLESRYFTVEKSIVVLPNEVKWPPRGEHNDINETTKI